MSDIQFNGQQTDERILYHAKPHFSMKYIDFGTAVIVGLFIIVGLQLIALTFGDFAQIVQIIGTAVILIVVGIILWWIHVFFDRTEIFVTDRRFVKFFPVHPFRRTMRSIFWDEAMKSKTFYRRNSLLERILGIGSLEVHARQNERDNVDIDYITYHDDLGHYIDKILFTFKNQPEEIRSLHEFIPKPRGKRY